MKDLKTLKKIDVFLIVLFAIITIIAILAALNPNFGESFSLKNFFEASELDKVPLWVAIGFTVLVCFLGALVPFPIPYALPISLFSAVWIKAYGFPAWGLILLLVFLATIANTIGDLVDYFIGEGANYVMSKDDPEVQNRWAQIILRKPKAIPGVIIIFALTPLPDVLLMVPLGMVKYDIKKTVLYMFIGRFIMLLGFALGGVFAIELAYGEGNGEIFGIPIVIPEWVLGIVFLYLTWLIVVAMVKLVPKTEKPVEQKKEADAE